MRILIIGGRGMLGHKLAQVLGSTEEVVVTVRDAAGWPGSIPVEDLIENFDVRDTAKVGNLLDRYRPDAVLNAAGVIKHLIDVSDPLNIIEVNAVFPNMLARFCSARGIRLIHYSTDCVFSGSVSSERGSNGYRESDLPDARDLYGMTKLLGEPPPPCLVLRTSMIGPELHSHHGLLNWFLSQGGGPVKGFTRALFTGLPTFELANVTSMILRNHPTIEGLWHVAAEPIDKCALLDLVKAAFGLRIVVEPYAEYYCDRRLDGTRFSRITGWNASPWPQLINAMRSDTMRNDGFDDEIYARNES